MSNQVDIIIRAVDKGVKRAFSGMARDVKKSRVALDAFNASMRRTSDAAGALTGRLSAAFAGIGAGVVTQSLFNAGVQAERLTLAFEAIAGNAGGAATELGYIRGEADRLGLVFYDTADAYKQIFAAGEAGGVSLEDTRKIFIGMAEAAAALGMTEEQATGSFRALGQMMGKNKVLAEELRTQMGEKLPTAIQFMAEAFGGTVAEMEKAMANGELGVETLIKFSEILHERYGAKAEEAAERAIGVLNKWKTAWWDLKIALAGSGFLDESVAMLERMTETLKDPAVQAAIKVWAERFFDIAGAMVKIAWEWKGWIAGMLGGAVVSSLLIRMVGVVQALTKAVIILKATNMGAWFTELATGIPRAGAVMSKFMWLLRGASASLLAFGVGWAIGTLLNKFDVVKRAGIEMSAALTKAWLKAKKAWAGLTGGDTAQIQRQIDEAERIYFEMHAEVGSGAEKAGKKMVNAHEAAATAAKKSAEVQKQSAGQVTDEIKKKYKELSDEIKSIQEQIAGRSQSLAEQLRSMGRTGMNDLGAWKDRKAEADEYAAAAEKAAKSGDFKTAIEFNDKAKTAYADLNTEVKITIKELIRLKTAQANVIKDSGWNKGSYQDYLNLQKQIAGLQRTMAREGADYEVTAVKGLAGRKTAMEGVEKVGKRNIELLKQEEAARKKAAEALDKEAGGALSRAMEEAGTATDSLTTKTNGYQEQLIRVNGIWEQNKALIPPVAAEIDKIVEKVNSMEGIAMDAVYDNMWDTAGMDQAVKDAKGDWGKVWEHFEENARGAISKSETRLQELSKDRYATLYIKEVVQKATGGAIGAVGMAAGGMFRSALNGFHFPGYGGGDRPGNLVMAEDGEVMIRKEMVKRAGLRAALAFNAGRWDVLLSELMARFSPAGLMMKSLGGMIAPRFSPEPLLMSGGGAVFGGGGGGSVSVNLNLPVDGPPVQATMNKMQLSELFRQVDRHKRLGS